MEQLNINFTQSNTTIYFDSNFNFLQELAPPEHSFIITDENLMMHYQQSFKPWKSIIIPAGESAKNLETIDDIIRQLIALDADRNATIIGIGGGVVTDIAGFVAATYKRGVKCGFVPTSILGMVDAAIGGKNGIDIGTYKNMIGTIKQPDFIAYNYDLLKTLPQEEWVNGFAEIIKHAAIADDKMFQLLENTNIKNIKKEEEALHQLIKNNVLIKTKIVQQDEFEKNERKKLNFGHTLAHAIENNYNLSHGFAVSIGMAFACDLSEQFYSFSDKKRLGNLLENHGLPITFQYNADSVFATLKADKKRMSNTIDFILLQGIGQAIIEPISLNTISEILKAKA